MRRYTGLQQSDLAPIRLVYVPKNPNFQQPRDGHWRKQQATFSDENSRSIHSALSCHSRHTDVVDYDTLHHSFGSAALIETLQMHG